MATRPQSSRPIGLTIRMIHINAEHAALIGDALSTVPYMAYLCEKHKQRAVVSGNFNPLVQELLVRYPFQFMREAQGEFTVSYAPNVANLMGMYANRMHMCQCFFDHNHEPVPQLPIT